MVFIAYGGREVQKLLEQVDARTYHRLWMFSQSNKTNYIMAVDGSMNVTRQNLPDGEAIFFRVGRWEKLRHTFIVEKHT